MFNFKTGTPLAVQQDQYLQKYFAGGTLTPREICDMEQNLWVAVASKLAPGNLVIRQWALIDLFKGKIEHLAAIQKMMNILTYKQKGPYKSWAEGYSYFGYMRDILDLWLKRFENIEDLSTIKDIIDKVNQGFIATSYPRNGLWYPAPFGDLRDIPLKPDLQIPHEMKTLAVSNVIFNLIESDNVIWYCIKGHPIGLNTHIPKNDSSIKIQNGIPTNFKFYEGYDKKYKNAWDEFKDIVDLQRLMGL